MLGLSHSCTPISFWSGINTSGCCFVHGLLVGCYEPALAANVHPVMPCPSCGNVAQNALSIEHSLIITFVNLTFLFTIGWLLVKKQKVTIAEVWQTAVPAIRLQVLALYFWAAVHKLNSDFFNPLVSCATTHKGLGHYAFLPQPEWLQWATIYGTVLLEGSLVLMLIFRRTRPFGIFLGLGFHFMLGIFDFHDFSSVMFCLLLLFAPHESAALFAKGQAWFQRIGWRFYWILPFILGSTYFAFRASFLPWPIYTISSAILQTIWVLLAITPLIWFVKIQWTAVQQGHYYQTKTLLQVKYKAILIVSLLAFLNGLTPYLGLKTELSYAMYSNLRTEGRQTNHFLIPTSWQLWDYQKDLVHITESDGGNLQYFMSNDYFLTYPLFQAEMNHSSASFVIYEHQGKTIELQSPLHPATIASTMDV